MSRHSRMIVLALSASVLVGCEDGAGPEGSGTFSIVMAAEPVVAGSSVSAGVGGDFGAVLGPGDPVRGRIPLDQVSAITLPIGLVEAREVSEDEEGPWVSAGTVGQEVNLLALPPEGIELLDSSLPQGDYDGLRFWLTAEPTITLTEEATVGQATYEVGTHPLRIPSADQAGVRLFVVFEVDEDGQQLTVLFDGDATVRGVTATGSGMLKIAPVLRVLNEAGEEVGGLDGETGE